MVGGGAAYCGIPQSADPQSQSRPDLSHSEAVLGVDHGGEEEDGQTWPGLSLPERESTEEETQLWFHSP